MSEVQSLEQAKRVFDTLCRTLDKNEWKYKRFDDRLAIECSARGDDLPMDFTITVDTKRNLVMLLSLLPYTIQDDHRIDVAVAVSAINNMLVDGSFDYNVATGELFFRMTNSFFDSELSGSVFEYMLFGACHMIDEYNDKLLMLAKGMLSIEKFLETLSN